MEEKKKFLVFYKDQQTIVQAHTTLQAQRIAGKLFKIKSIFVWVVEVNDQGIPIDEASSL